MAKIEISRLLGTNRCVPQEKFLRKPYNKFIDQACLVELDVIKPFLLLVFLGVPSTTTCLELDMDLVSFHRYFRVTACLLYHSIINQIYLTNSLTVTEITQIPS